MTRSWTLVAVALMAVAAVRCGNSSSSPTQDSQGTGVLRLSFPDPVVAVPSTDSRFAMEAVIPMVVTEVSGAGWAVIDFVQIGMDDEATGLRPNPYPVVTFANPRFVGYPMPDPVPVLAGSTVECSFRVGLYQTGTYRGKVILNAWTPRPNSIYNDQTQYSSEFRIVPPR
jgi:hypothetical protein